MINTRIHHVDLCAGIRRTPKFEKKGLATHSANVGLKCGHDCTYCSTGACNRCHEAFRRQGEKPYEFGYAIIDPNIPEKFAAGAARRERSDVVQLCTSVDAWDPAAQQHNLGRRSLKALLENGRATVRILTKNAAVAKEFDLVRQHRRRVLVGLSLTGTTAKEDRIKVIEPNASTISERMAALKEAHTLGLRTYGMLCPLLPGISDSCDDIAELVGFVKDCGAEKVFAEAVNPRGRGLILTAEKLRDYGYYNEADAVGHIRKRSHRMEYVVQLIRNVQRAMREHGMVRRLRFLLYESDLTDDAARQIRRDAAGVVWL